MSHRTVSALRRQATAMLAMAIVLAAAYGLTTEVWVGGLLALLALLGPMLTLWRLRSTPEPSPQDVHALPNQPPAADSSVVREELVSAAQAINETVDTQTQQASQQTAVIEQIAARLETFLTLSDQMDEQARSVTTIASQAATTVSRGQQALQTSTSGMEQIREQVTVIAESIMTLSSLTQRIDIIVGSVSEIATQSNLLALNASIEAARAGVHGQGFAAVADEVRTLAGQSTQAADEVRTLLREVQAAIAETIEATHSGLEEVQHGIQASQELNTAMRQIAAEIDASSQATLGIYEGVRQQTQAMDEIAANVERVNRISQRAVTEMQVFHDVSDSLTRLSDELKRTPASQRTLSQPS